MFILFYCLENVFIIPLLNCYKRIFTMDHNNNNHNCIKDLFILNWTEFEVLVNVCGRFLKLSLHQIWINLSFLTDFEQ